MYRTNEQVLLRKVGLDCMLYSSFTNETAVISELSFEILRELNNPLSMIDLVNNLSIKIDLADIQGGIADTVSTVLNELIGRGFVVKM